MGSFFEINDTLQITEEQGFPSELNYEKHTQKLLSAEDFKGKIFQFKNKPNIRIYQMPPVRVFLVQNIDGKWLYWGLVHILEIVHDYKNKTTSGKFEIVHIYKPEEIKTAHILIDRNKDTNYF
ncbi:MAG: hypothetical protein M1324_01845 [Patescibacteria group bacterium]|nr:hypothetical protein [Patescibacteria group bacterium]